MKISPTPDKNMRASNLGGKLLQEGLNGSSVKKRKTALNCRTGCWCGFLVPRKPRTSAAGIPMLYHT